jgi:hypothetical protein
MVSKSKSKAENICRVLPRHAGQYSTKFFLVVVFAVVVLLLPACSPANAGAQPPQVASPSAAAQVTPTPTSPQPSPDPSMVLREGKGGMATATPAAVSLTPSPTPTNTPTGPTPTATPDTRLDPAHWDQWPVIPTVSAAAAEIYKRGLALGNDPHVYSTIGDCQSEPDVFLGIYATNRYWLGTDYTYLQDTIDFFKNSFNVQSLAVRNGLSAPSALDPLWDYKGKCNPNESPVACDLRVHKPSIVFINLGTNWLPDASTAAYTKYLRQIIDLVIKAGALPVLATKADDVEGGNRINQATAQLAHDYDIPLWNLWRGVQDLPNGGLDPARKDVYLTTEAWDRRNFTALMVLDRLQKDLRPIYEAKQNQ